MNHLSRSIALFLLLGCGMLKAETFTDAALGVSITTPGGWRHNDKDDFGYVIRNSPAARSNQIRLHRVDSKIASPEEAAKSLANRLKERNYRGSDLLSSKPVTTASGLKGYLASIGSKNADGSPFISINHYYFQKPDNSIICACAYVNGKSHIADAFEKIILGTLRLTETTPAADTTPSKEQKTSYAAESFFAPRMTLSISTLQSKNPPRDAFVQLLEQPDKRVLASLHWPEARRISALWSPDSSMVAINYQTDNQLARMKVFRVSASGLADIPLPKSLSIKKLAPPNSPLRESDPANENITSARWKSAGELFCVVERAGKNPAVSYEALLGFNGKEATLLSSKLIDRKR